MDTEWAGELDGRSEAHVESCSGRTAVTVAAAHVLEEEAESLVNGDSEAADDTECVSEIEGTAEDRSEACGMIAVGSRVGESYAAAACLRLEIAMSAGSGYSAEKSGADVGAASSGEACAEQ